MNIPVRHDLPGVGRNLHDHLASPVHMKMAHPASYGVSVRALPRNLWNIAEYLLRRSGPLANNIFESAAFVKSRPDLDKPDLQLVFQPAKRPSPSFPYPLGHGFAISPVGLYPRSRGTVSLANPDPFSPPVINPNLLSAPEDLPPLIHGIRLARQIFASSAFTKYRAQETSPGATLNSDEELADYIRAQAYTVHHPVSTCRMGGDSNAVVDQHLRVIGIDGLRVADASVFPSIIGGNTNAAIVMIAEKASDMILGRPPLPPAQLPEP
jgi:choline dehydrogenase